MTTIDARSTGTDAVQAELEAIAAQCGGVLPARAVVDFARNPDTALHQRFTWDDGEAAEKWRLQEARHIIASVKIEPRPDVTVRAWCSLPDDRIGDEPVYRPVVKVLSNADLRAQLLKSVVDELGRFKAKHKNLSELASVWKAIDEVSHAG